MPHGNSIMGSCKLLNNTNETNTFSALIIDDGTSRIYKVKVTYITRKGAMSQMILIKHHPIEILRIFFISSFRNVEILSLKHFSHVYIFTI